MLASFSYYLRCFIAYDRKGLFAALALILASAALDAVLALALVPLLEIFLGLSGSGMGERLVALLESMGLANAIPIEVGIVALFAGLVFARSVVVRWRTLRLARLSQGFVRHWRIRLFAALDRADWQSALDQRRHNIHHVLTDDVGRIAAGAESTIRATTGIVMALSQCCVALLLAPALGAVFFAVSAVAAMAFFGGMLGSAHSRGEVQVRNARELHRHLHQYLAGLKSAKVHPHRDFALQMDRVADAIADNTVAFLRGQANAQFALQVGSAALLLVLLALGLLVFDTPPAALIVFLAIIVRISPLALALAGNAQGIANTLPAFENVIAFEAALATAGSEARIPARPQACAASVTGPIGVAFDEVSFRYHRAAEPIIQRLSFETEPGSVNGLVGPTGIGKTTVLDLVAGILQPTTGIIRLVRRDGETIGAAEIPSVLSYATQEPVLFDATVRENLLWNGTEADEELIGDVLDIVAARELVENLPQGLDTRVGDMGLTLSGGERQRLFLAAMILRQPGLLIMDEALSAVDLKTEARIFASLRRLANEMTIVAVTHRKPDPAIFDRVIDLGDRASKP